MAGKRPCWISAILMPGAFLLVFLKPIEMVQELIIRQILEADP